VPSRRKLSSTALRMCCRNEPSSLGYGPIRPRHLDTGSRRSRLPRPRIQRPRIFSGRPTVSRLPPSRSTSAVSRKSRPASKAASRISNETFSSACGNHRPVVHRR
jgi:hypothetical protein